METTNQHDNSNHENGFYEPRKEGTMMNGKYFDDITINQVWEKALPDFGFHFYRRDTCGTVIAKHEYFTKTKYGWFIDHIVPVSKGGTDDLDNLQPLHWENNQSKGDDYPEWKGKYVL